VKAALISVFGGPDVVTIGQTNLRNFRPHEAAVRVEAAGVNPLDVKIIAGYMHQFFPVEFPYVPGTDFSGVVEAVGAQVTSLTPGDRVVGRIPPGGGGAFAKGLVIPAEDLRVIPAEMNFEQAAALPTAFGTARQGVSLMSAVCNAASG
jgi:NADPH:quinone reductase-like Zn-dependent oxidoreductase